MSTTKVAVSKITEDTFAIVLPEYDKYIAGRIKKLEGACWDAANGRWIVPIMSLGQALIKGEMKHWNQLRQVRRGFLSPNTDSVEIVYTDLVNA